MAITPLPTAPSRNDPPSIFNDRADAWVASLPPWTDEVNALAIEVSDDADTAVASADSASASAISAVAAPGTNATSTTSVLIGLGSKAFTIQTGKDFVVGMEMISADDAAPTTNRMFGGVASYDSGTGALVLDVTDFDGAGTISSWTISISGRAGLDGGANIVLDTTPQLGGSLDRNGFDITGEGDTELLSFTEIAPYDLSTMSGTPIIASVSGQDGVPTGVVFSNDGLKVFVVGAQNDSIYEYALGSAFDLTTISGVQVTKPIGGQDGGPQGIVFNDTGSKLFLIGGITDTIYEYTLSTPFDMNTLVYSGVSKAIDTVDDTPRGITLNNNGTKLFFSGGQHDAIYEFDLGTPYDLSTLSSLQVTAIVASEDTNPSGIAFNSTGNKIFMVGSQHDSIYEYELGVAYDLDTISIVRVKRPVDSDDTDPRGLAFDNTGLKLFITGTLNDSIYEYSLGTPSDAVNEVSVKNNTTSNGPAVLATGADADIDLHLAAKGAGKVKFDFNVDGQDKEVSGVFLKNYGETVNIIGSIGGGVQDINLRLGNSVSATVDTSPTTFTISNPSASGNNSGFTLLLNNGSSQTVTWPVSVKWPGGFAPLLSSTGTDILVFLTFDGGVTWHGSLAIADSK